ncbi:MAG TPA: hypothetical protein VJ732_16335 [Bryobacteraceae bacterium]|nr:hypothetical protein [Bryobacteraceae bacterium]
MVKAGGNCTPDGKGGFNCANVDSRQFQCSQPPPSNSSSASSQDNCYTPARGPQCAPVRFGWGDCPGSKQACQWCYGPNGVFAYQPRGSLYSLESGCNSLGRDTIWQTNSPQAEQAMVRAGGSCKANGSGGYYCTNVDPKRYQQIQK